MFAIKRFENKNYKNWLFQMILNNILRFLFCHNKKKIFIYKHLECKQFTVIIKKKKKKCSQNNAATEVAICRLNTPCRQ